MGRFRINYFDVVGRAVGGLDPRAVGRAVTALSATYRAGGHDLDFQSEVGRAAYLWHHLPAHVCDLARLFADLLELLEDREVLRLVGLGAGPGSEVLALVEAVSAARARGQLLGLRALEAARVDRVAAWDATFQALLGPALEQVSGRCPDLGEAWTVSAAPAALVADLGAGPPPAPVLRAVARADLVVAANLVSEVAPRGTDAPPPGLSESFRAVFAACEGPTDVLLVDRAGAPGVTARLEALAALARQVDPTLEETGAPARETRCACTLTRPGQAVYRHVHLPTTRDADRPVRNLRSAWRLLRLHPAAPGGSQA